MKIFSCFTRDDVSSTPTLSFVFAADDERATALARRELSERAGAKSVEIYEGDRRVGVVCPAGPAR